MPQVSIQQNAFNAGQISERLLGRGDIPGYQNGVQQAFNVHVLRTGGLEGRTGSRLAYVFDDHTELGRLVRLRRSADQTFVLLWTEGRMRVMTTGGIVTHGTLLLDQATAVDPTVNEIVFENHGYREGTGPLRFTSSDTLPGNLLAGVDYFATFPAVTTFPAADVVTGTDTINAANDFRDGQGPFRLETTNALPAGLAIDTDVYVRNPTSSSYQLALSSVGVPINLTSQGTGTHTLSPSAEYKRTRFQLRKAVGPTVSITSTGTGDLTVEPIGDQILTVDFPYQEDQLHDITLVGSKDVMYIQHPKHRYRKIERLSPTAWRVVDVDLLDGPYLREREVRQDKFEDDVTLSFSADTGTVTCTASKPIFDGTDVTRLLRVGGITNALLWGWGKIVGVSAFAWDDLDIQVDAIVSGDVNPGADSINSGGHNFFDGEGPVQVDVADYGLTPGTDYFVHAINANNYSLHLNQVDALADANRVNLVAGTLGMVFTSSWIHKAHSFTDRAGPVTLTTSGTLPDGDLAVDTAYYVRIEGSTAFSFSRQATGVSESITSANGNGIHQVQGNVLTDTCELRVERELPDIAATTHWRLGAFGPAEDLGFPSAVSLHEQRLVYAGNEDAPQTVYAGAPGALELFEPDVDDPNSDVPEQRVLGSNDAGYVYRLESDDTSAIQWLRSLSQLVAGSAGGLWPILASSRNEALTPDNVNANRSSVVRSSNVAPVLIGSTIIFVDANRNAIHAAEYQFDRDSIVPEDLTALADTLTEASPVMELTNVEQPLRIVYARLEDGTVLALAFDREQSVRAWSTYGIAGTDAMVESISEASRDDGGELWMIVSRTIEGETRRHVEFLAPRFRKNTPADDAYFVDAGPAPYDGPPQTVFGGFEHLVGETVVGLADGSPFAPKVVAANGTITFDTPKSKVTAGLGYRQMIETLPPELPAGSGNKISLRTKRVIEATLRFYRTGGGGGLKLGPTLDKLDPFNFRSPADPTDTPVPLQTGVFDVPVESGFSYDGTFFLVQDDPLPFTVLSLMQRVEYAEQ